MKIVEKDRVLKTNDYSLFKIDYSYKFSKIKLESLEIEMSIKNLCQDLPILIDENFNILDGKYKFTACKNLKLPVYYKVAVISNKIDLLKAKELIFKPTIHDYLMAHSDKLFYRKVVDWKTVLKFSYSDILSSIVGLDYKNHTKCKLSKDFKDGLYEYEPQYDFIFKKLFDFNTRFNETYTGLKYYLSDSKDILDINDYNLDKTFNEILNTKHLEYFLILANEHHPSICDIFTFMAEVNDLYHDININDTVKTLMYYRNEIFDQPKYPNLLLIESYLGKSIFVK